MKGFKVLKSGLLIGCMLLGQVALAQPNKLSKDDVNKVLDQMKAQGQFSAKDIESARAQLNKYSDSELNQMVEKAKTHANDPEIQRKAQNILNNYRPSN